MHTDLRQYRVGLNGKDSKDGKKFLAATKWPTLLMIGTVPHNMKWTFPKENLQISVFTFMFQTGEQMGDVDLKIRFKMEDLANVTQMLMQNIKALAVLQ